jgi:Ca2+-binding RTX toxin-like protein
MPIKLKWTKLLGTPTGDWAFGVAVSSDNSAYIVGASNGGIGGQTNSGSLDAFLSKYSSEGELAWTRLVGSTSFDAAWDVAVGKLRQVYLVGEAHSVIDGPSGDGSFLARFSNNGQREWITRPSVGGFFQYGSSPIDVGTDGSLFVGGIFSGPTMYGIPNKGMDDAQLLKFDASGKQLSGKLYGGPRQDAAFDIKTTVDGSIVMSGYTTIQDPTNAWAWDVYVGKYSASGDETWLKTLNLKNSFYTDSNHIYIAGTALGADNSIYIAGGTTENLVNQNNNGGFDGFLFKFDGSGNLLWSKLLGSSDNDVISDLIVGKDGKIYVVGSTNGDLDGNLNKGGADIFVSSFSSDGTKLETTTYGSVQDDYAEGIAHGSDGTIYATGATYGNLNGEIGNGEVDAFILAIVDKSSIRGTVGNDKLMGTRDDDILEGLEGNDAIYGSFGNDVLMGGLGNDYLDGGNGSDTADYSEKSGAISVALNRSASGFFRLNSSTWTNVKVGGKVEDKIRSIENIIGGSGDDNLSGNNAANRLTGSGGSDTINGGLGADVLTGGAGNDRFIFNTKLGASNLDTITDFGNGADKIVFSKSVFGSLKKGIAADNIVTGTTAELAAHAFDSNDFLVYNTETHVLSYDADGSGKAAAVAVAEVDLVGIANLAHTDFLIM